MNTRVLTEPMGSPEADGRDVSGGLPWFAGALLILALAAALAGGLRLLLDPQTMPIRHVRVTGEFVHLSPEELQVMARDVVRGGFFNVNVATIRDVLEQEPWVENVAVRRIWPDGLMLEVSEQVPRARWGDEALLNGRAERFAPAPETWPEGLPVLKGPAGKETELLSSYEYMQEIVGRSNLRIREIRVSDRRAWTLELADGPSVVLGRRDFIERFELFASIVPTHLQSRLDRMQSVDMRYTNGFALNWKENSDLVAEKEREAYGQAN